jgi:nitrogen fixation protein
MSSMIHSEVHHHNAETTRVEVAGTDISGGTVLGVLDGWPQTTSQQPFQTWLPEGTFLLQVSSDFPRVNGTRLRIDMEYASRLR